MTDEADLEYARHKWADDVPPAKAWLCNLNGRCSGWMPQWKWPEEEAWRDIKLVRLPVGDPSYVNSADSPFVNGGILETIRLCGESQAWAIAWQYAASAEARAETIEVRIEKHEVEFEIKARVVE